MRIYLIYYLLIATFSLFGREVAPKPNILLIITDQQTADAMSFVGNSYLKTPAIDMLAGEGIHFENSYAVQPLCQPFRTSLLTGRYPHETGTTTNLKPVIWILHISNLYPANSCHEENKSLSSSPAY